MLPFEQAIAHTMLCARGKTLDALAAVARTWGGLDPGSYRGFAFLRGDPAGVVGGRVHLLAKPVECVDVGVATVFVPCLEMRLARVS